MTENDVRIVLSQNLKRLRKQRALSQLKLANELQIAMTFISDIENCKKWVSPETLAKIASFFEVPLSDLFLSDENICKENENNIQTSVSKAFALALKKEIENTIEEICERFEIDIKDRKIL